MSEIPNILGAFKIPLSRYSDQRGSFNKLNLDNQVVKEFTTTELFFTSSKKGTFRGMHLQWGVHSTEKIITLVSGSLHWFLIDCRTSPHNVMHHEIISEPFANSYYIPAGVAQGYLTLEDQTTVMYQMSGKFCQKCDTGISSPLVFEELRRNSRGIEQISQRDLDLGLECKQVRH